MQMKACPSEHPSHCCRHAHPGPDLHRHPGLPQLQHLPGIHAHLVPGEVTRRPLVLETGRPPRNSRQAPGAGHGLPVDHDHRAGCCLPRQRCSVPFLCPCAHTLPSPGSDALCPFLAAPPAQMAMSCAHCLCLTPHLHSVILCANSLPSPSPRWQCAAPILCSLAPLLHSGDDL